MTNNNHQFYHHMLNKPITITHTKGNIIPLQKLYFILKILALSFYVNLKFYNRYIGDFFNLLVDNSFDQFANNCELNTESHHRHLLNMCVIQSCWCGKNLWCME